MSKFLTPLDYRDLDGDTWLLLADLEYFSQIARGVITAHRGFKTDLASIPGFFHRVLPKSGPHNYAAVIHDLLYQNNGVCCVIKSDGRKVAMRFTRGQCDMIFREGMLAPKPNGISTKRVGGIRREAMFIGVRTGGWMAWGKHERRNEKNPIIDPCGTQGDV